MANSIQKFFKKDSSAGIVLVIAAIVALIVANSPLNEFYNRLLELKFSLGFSGLHIKESVLHWINDGLMAIFFLLVGLEIKRELKFGKLSSFRSAFFPVITAIVGATIPALIFWGINSGTAYLDGWAIPMATDIAFVIGIIAILGSKLPTWVKVFATTIAVVDDLIAVLVIAFFYTSEISFMALGIAAISVLILISFNLKKVNSLAPYMLVGFVMWWAVLESGVHATIAGVILAFTIPLHRGWSLEKMQDYARDGFDLFVQAADEGESVTQKQAIKHLNQAYLHFESPLKRLEHKLHKPVYFVIMPLFAFANAGIVLNTKIMEQAFTSPLTWGIMVGLFIGKQVGIFAASWVIIKFFSPGITPNREMWKVLYGIGLLCGIGFTMSIFIANLSFTDPLLLEMAKLGIFAGSLVSGLAGYFVLRSKTHHKAEDQEPLNVPI